MSIITAILGFITKLFKSIETQYNKLEPTLRGYIETGIAYTNELKTSIDKPTGEIIVLLENAVGQETTTKVSNILGKVAVDLGIAEHAIENPWEALEAIKTHIKPLQGNKWADTVFDIAKYIAMHLSDGQLNRNLLQIMVQWAYDHIFANTFGKAA